MWRGVGHGDDSMKASVGENRDGKGQTYVTLAACSVKLRTGVQLQALKEKIDWFQNLPPPPPNNSLE